MSNSSSHCDRTTSKAGSIPRIPSLPVTVFALVTLSALVMRLHHLDHESLFMDELRQVAYYDQEFAQIIEYAATQQQTPLDYWIGHFVNRFSGSDWAVRLPAALFGTGSVLLIMLIVRRCCAWGTAAVAGAMMALLPFNLYYSQQARPYAIAVFFLLALVGVLILVRGGSRFRWWSLPLLLLVTTGFLLSRTLSPLVVVTVLFALLVAHCGAGLVWRRFREAGRTARSGWAAGVMALSMLLYLPVLLRVLFKGDRYVSASTPLSETIGRGFGEFTLAPLWRAFVVQMEPVGYVVMPLIAIGLLLGRRSRTMRGSHVPTLCALLLVGSAVLNIFVFKATTSTPFRPPYAIYVLPLMLILSAAAFQTVCDATDRWRRRNLPRSLLAVTAGCLILWTGHSAWQFKQMKRNTDWRGLTQYLQEQYAEDHILLGESVTNLGSWKPTYFGFPRYYRGLSSRIGVPGLVHRAPTLIESTKEPVFVLFVYPRYLLTPCSRYAVMGPPRTSVPVDLSGLEQNPRLNVQRFIGSYVLRLTRPTGRLGADSLSIVEMLIEALPRHSCVVELHLAAASLRCALNQPRWQAHLESAESLAGAQWREQVELIASRMRTRRCVVTPETAGEDGDPGP